MTAPLPPGTILNNCVRIERVLNDEGGMGVLYAGTQLDPSRPVAVKVMRPEFAANVEMRAKFADEAAKQACIEHPNVVPVYVAGEDPAHGRWIAMQLLEGSALDKVLEPGKGLDLAVFRRVFRQICAGVQAGHEKKIIHCDLKPENAFVLNPGAPPERWDLKVLDYGISRRITSGTKVTLGQQIAGSVCWMAAEQLGIGSPTLSPRTDVWALGLIAFYLLTGKHYQRKANDADPDAPFAIAFELALRNHPLDPADQRAREQGFQGALPEGFDAWFQRCIALQPAERYANAREADEALEALLERLEVTTTKRKWVSPIPPVGFYETSSEVVLATTRVSDDPNAARQDPHPTLPVTLTPVTAPVPPELASPRRPRLLALASLGVIGFLATGAGVMWRRERAVVAPRTPSVPQPTSAARSPSALPPTSAARSPSALPSASRCTADMALIEGPSPFCIRRSEVTAGEVGNNASTTARIPDGGVRGSNRLCNAARPNHGDHPANCIDWHAARAWCRAHGGDLPTEAQWLLAAGGGSPTAAFPWGSEAPNAERLNACGRECLRAWQSEGALYDADDGAEDTARVGTFPRGDTPSGVHDLAGNVSEWTVGPGDSAVARGGNWSSRTADEVNVRTRIEHDGATRLPTLGFRCVMRPQEK